jgi:hypothetical protein
VSFFKKLHQKHSIPRPHHKSSRTANAGLHPRICRIEQMESRELLSASSTINVGVTYIENASGTDAETTTNSGEKVADLFEVTFTGGSSGTYLQTVTINLTSAYFDTTSNTTGVYDYSAFKVVSGSGVTSSEIASYSVTDGGSSITITFTAGTFSAGEKFIFSIDVDENSNNSSSAASTLTVEGNELCGSFNASLLNTGYKETDVSGTGFTDAYDTRFKNLDSTLASVLPNDAYTTNNYYIPTTTSSEGDAGYTAGDCGSATQVALPTISGTVYTVDYSLTNGTLKETTSVASGVTVTLLKLNTSTGEYEYCKKTTTGTDGTYSFTLEEGGTYKVVEGTYNSTTGKYTYTNASGYDLDLKCTVGNIDGTTVGSTSGDNTIQAIVISDGQDSVQNNFYDTRSSSISGYIFVDNDEDGKADSGEYRFEGVTVYLYGYDSDGNLVATKKTTTDSNGKYTFSDLEGNLYYKVSLDRTQTQFKYYTEDNAYAGYAGTTYTVGTVASDLDSISEIALGTGIAATEYNFTEIRSTSSLSGYVYYDANSNGTKDTGEDGINGVTVTLTYTDSDGVKHTETQKTANSGKYTFDDLPVGYTYTVTETQPTNYKDGAESKGTPYSCNISVNDVISAITITSSTGGTDYNFGELLLPATISGYVYQDGSTIITAEGETVYVPSVRDGVKTSDDTPLVGITLILCDGSGVPLTDSNGNYITTTTDANGYYSFSVEAGTYSVMEVRPDGYTAGVDLTGSGSSSRVGAESVLNIYTLSTVDTSGMTKSLVAEISSSTVSLLANITVKAGDSAVNYNFSEVKITTATTPNPPPVPPTPPLIEPPAQDLAADLGVLSYAYNLAPLTIMQPIFGGTGGPSGYTWHLSVIDGGSPRSEESSDTVTAYTKSEYFDASTWSGDAIDQGEWTLADQSGKVMKKFRFGLRKGIPVTGDWDGSGTTKIGVFINGLWFFDLNGDGKWDENDLWAKLGKDNDQPVTGDWDGDGKTDIAIFGPMWLGDPRAVEVDPGLPDAQNTLSGRQKNLPPDAADATVGYRTLKRGETGKIRSDVIDHVFQYGTKGDIAVTGDWNGDGINTIGIFRNGTWFLDMDGDGRWSAGDVMVEFGQEGDIPVVGDWNGDGISKIGVYRKGTFYLDTNNNHQLDASDKVFELGGAGDKPVVGDWNGEGVDKVGIYHDLAVGAVSDSIPEAAASTN